MSFLIYLKYARQDIEIIAAADHISIPGKEAGKPMVMFIVSESDIAYVLEDPKKNKEVFLEEEIKKLKH